MKWDSNFDRFILKDYDNWRLTLHKSQFPYLGRTYVWAHREEADLITDINSEETRELFGIVIPDWDNAMREFLGDAYNRSNVAILGNESPHLHAHLIPRLNRPVNRYGIEFVDPNPRGNYSPYDKRDLGEEILMKVKADVLALL